MTIPLRTLDENIQIPGLGFGTWRVRGGDSIKIIKQALDLGYRLIDTAEIYQNEGEIGQAIKGIKRKELFIISKVMPGNLYFDAILQAGQDSLDRLQTPYIDLYLIHAPSPKMDFDEVFTALKTLLDEGKIRSIGVSNFNISYLVKSVEACKKLGIKIVANQVEFNPLSQPPGALLMFCAANSIEIISHTPLADSAVIHDEILKKIALKYNKTPAQVSLRWLIQKNTIPIPKASTKAHLKENLEVFDFELGPEEMVQIDEITRLKYVI